MSRVCQVTGKKPMKGHYVSHANNKRTTPDKIEMKKYDPKARKHVLYKETKLK